MCGQNLDILQKFGMAIDAVKIGHLATATIQLTVLHMTAIYVYISDLKNSMLTFTCDNVLKYPFMLTQMDCYSNEY